MAPQHGCNRKDNERPFIHESVKPIPLQLCCIYRAIGPPKKSDNLYFCTKHQQLILAAAHVLFAPLSSSQAEWNFDWDCEKASLVKAKEKIVQKDNQKASSIKDLKKQLEQKEKENASLIKANEEIAQKENEKALLVRDLQNQLEQKDNENASLIKAKQKIAQKAFEKALLVRDLQNQLEQKDNENAFLIKAKQKIAQKEYEKALLVRDLQNQLEQKDNENSSLIKAKEEIAQKEYEKALLVRDLQKQLARTEKEFVQKANEHASLVGDFEKELAQQVNDELAQRIYSQPQVDGETWQFQGDSGEWVSFPASLNMFSMFGLFLFSQMGDTTEGSFLAVSGFLSGMAWTRIMRTRCWWCNWEKAMRCAILS